MPSSAGKKKLQHPFLQDRMLDDDSARETIKVLIKDRKQDPNVEQTKSGPSETDVRARVKDDLLKEKEWKKELAEGDKLVKTITKLVPGIEKLISKAKPGTEVFLLIRSPQRPTLFPYTTLFR